MSSVKFIPPNMRGSAEQSNKCKTPLISELSPENRSCLNISNCHRETVTEKCLNTEFAEEESFNLTENSYLYKTADEDLSSIADDSSKEECSVNYEEVPMDLSRSSQIIVISSNSSCSEDDWKKVVTKKFKPPKPQNKALDNAKKPVSKKSQIEDNIPKKTRTASSESSKNEISKRMVKRKYKTTQECSKKTLRNLPNKAFTSADSSSEMFSALPESNNGLSNTEDFVTNLSEQSESVLKAVTLNIDADFDDSSREVTSSADFTENKPTFHILHENKSNPPVSPVNKSSSQSLPAKKSNTGTTASKKSGPRLSPTKKTSASISSEEIVEVTQSDKQCMNITNVSEETHISLTKEEDKENETPKKKSKLNTSTPKSSQKNTTTCSPWGYHYAKQSQDNVHNELDGAGDHEEVTEEDSQVTNFSQATNASLNSTFKKERMKSIYSTPKTSSRHTSVERSPWGHHYSKMRTNSQNGNYNASTKVTKTMKYQKESKSKESQKFCHESEDMFDNNSSSDSEAMSSISIYKGSTTKAVSPRKTVMRLSQTSLMPLSEDTIVTQRERLEWLHEQRNVGVWVQCMNSDCRAYRYLADVQDPLEVPIKWYCRQHPDVKYQICKENITEIECKKGEYVVESDYNAGSIVWAKVEGFPWWPAMVDDDPDIELYYWLPTGAAKPNFYNVVFFDSKSVTRAWIGNKYIHKYGGYENCTKFKTSVKEKQDIRNRVFEAKQQAADALTLRLLERLSKYSFIARYTGPINDPLTKEQEEKMKLKKSNKKKTKKRRLEE